MLGEDRCWVGLGLVPEAHDYTGHGITSPQHNAIMVRKRKDKGITHVQSYCQKFKD